MVWREWPIRILLRQNLPLKQSLPNSEHRPSRHSPRRACCSMLFRPQHRHGPIQWLGSAREKLLQAVCVQPTTCFSTNRSQLRPNAKVITTSRNIRAMLQTVVCTVIIIATELCVKWNKFKTQELVEAGQLFSVLFAAVILARVLYLIFKEDIDQVLKSMPRIL